MERFEEAELLILMNHPRIVAAVGDSGRDALHSYHRIVALYDAWGKPDKAAEWRAKLPAEQEAVASDAAKPSDDAADE